MTDSIMLNGKKYSRKKEMEDLGYERYNITISDMGKYLVVVREQWYDPKTGAFCGSSSLINKEPLPEKSLSDKEDLSEWRLTKGGTGIEMKNPMVDYNTMYHLQPVRNDLD